ncbi:hypothetical protein SLEP1_g7216 [Rubroshorea leprosula]|uniref:Uncharacterized protein n=1 Tax=Rubroshorea leprosula TaxID=152421 RepID=A0AAV5I8I8_9ROSI|nr:hypothetical protein SLEP1_g7216 [Rubroshorea leprosula]
MNDDGMNDEGKIVFSLSNGEVFVAHLHNNGEVRKTLLGKHLKSVSGLIRDTDNPNLGYSCGKDAFIKCFDIRSPRLINLQKCYRFEGNPSLPLKLNGILQNPDDPRCITVCGNDPYVRVYDLRLLKEDSKCLDNVYLPHDLANRSTACIKGIAYSKMGQLLASCNNQKIYMFQQEMGLDPKSIHLPLHLNALPICLSEAQVYQGHTVDNQLDRHDITFFGSEDEYIASGSACGKIFFWNKREPKRVSCIESLHIVRCMTRNPRPNHPIQAVLATGGVDQFVRLWGPNNERLSRIEDG